MSEQTSAGQKSMSQEFADFLINFRYEAIPEKVLEAAKTQILDALGIALLANSIDLGKTIYRAGTAASAKIETGGARTIGFGTRFPTADAALINGVLIWSVGFDGTHTAAGIHPIGPALAASLASGEEQSADGRAFLAAYIAALEVSCRLGGPRGNPFHPRGFHPTALAGTFGAAVAASRLRGLDLAATVNALGLCGSQAAGSLEVMGSWQMWFHVGWAAHAGLIATSVAAEGFTGSINIFEGPNGFYQSHLGFIPTREELHLDSLGDRYMTAEITLKPYPNCQAVQSFTDAAFALKAEGIDWREIEHVDCMVSKEIFRMVVDPPPMKKFPLDREAAGFNIPYAVGGAMIKDRADYKYYHEDPLDDPDILAFVKRFDYKQDLESDYPIHFPGELRVTLKDGRKAVKRIVASKGSPEWPMTPSEIENKFMDHALRVMTRETANRLIDTVMNLESMADVAALLDAAIADAN